MKLNKIVLSASLGLFAACGIANAADQGHGTINFHGSIIDAPCSISPDSTNDVNLGQISTSELTKGGMKSNTRPIQIILENCDLTTMSEALVTFSGTEAVTAGMLAIQGQADGAGIVLTDGVSNVALPLNQESTPITLKDIPNNILNFSAYLAPLDSTNPVVVPGEFTSIATFTMNYQ
ncbi:type 1 fimbrial protein [Providencia rettgeri]